MQACAKWGMCLAQLLGCERACFCVGERGSKEVVCKLVAFPYTVDCPQVFTIDTLLCFNHISVTRTCIKWPVHPAWREQRSLAELPQEVGSYWILSCLLRGWARPSTPGSAEAELASIPSLRPGFIHSHLDSDLWLRLIQCVIPQKVAKRDLERLTYPY